jgi:hypothetical protein
LEARVYQTAEDGGYQAEGRRTPSGRVRVDTITPPLSP